MICQSGSLSSVVSTAVGAPGEARSKVASWPSATAVHWLVFYPVLMVREQVVCE